MKTAEKTEKLVTRSTAKIFDVAHPGKSAPSSSGRPVIITNRPIMQDPMMSSQPNDAQLSVKPAEKIFIKPLSESDESTKDVQNDTKGNDFSDAVTASVEIAAEAEEANVPAPTEEVAATEVAMAPPQDVPAKPEEKPETKSSEETVGTPTEDGVNAETKEQKELAELEAKAKEDEEIAKLVEAKQYFLPINALERRRSKFISLLGLVLIVVLGLVLLDLMLDTGMIHIPGVSSATHFFS